MKRNVKAFTLVELAIVITIIGLLIGGVLKGQELLENARMTSNVAQITSFSTATVTFKDIYKAMPGDIRDPQNFIQNCTTTPCSLSGNGNGMVGTSNNSNDNENMAYWAHLARAGLVAGIDPNSSWVLATFWNNAPALKMGGQSLFVYLEAPSFWNYYDTPLSGYYYETLQSTDGGTNSTSPHKMSTAVKYDLKTDDGKPLSGDVRVLAALGSNVYDANSSTMVRLIIKAGF